MKFLKSEDGVSEVVGAMLILLILVLFLGGLQVNEVPKWNKELERQQFDVIYSDFVNLRSNLEDASEKNIPKASSLHMGVKYPERFMLTNPGEGAYGSITTYPLNINITYNSTGTMKYMNYTSEGIIYEMNSISVFPKLVYENGIIIKDFGNWNYTDDFNRLTTNDSIFIPILTGVEPVSSLEVESLNIMPIPQGYYINPTFDSMNVTIETRYPEIWANLRNDSRPPGSKFSVDKVNRKIKITDVYGFEERMLALPKNTQLYQNKMYTGLITFADTVSGVGASNGCADPGRYISNKNQGCVDLPPNASQFIIKDIAMVDDAEAELIFNVRDASKTLWEVNIKFKSDSSGDPYSASINQRKPKATCGATLSNGQIDLTTCYNSVGISNPNVLKIKKIDNNLLHVYFLIT